MSHSAVSHHLQILKEAGIVSVRREGTRNYYYFDAGDRCEMVIQLLKKVQQIEDMVPKPRCMMLGLFLTCEFRKQLGKHWLPLHRVLAAGAIITGILHIMLRRF